MRLVSRLGKLCLFSMPVIDLSWRTSQAYFWQNRGVYFGRIESELHGSVSLVSTSKDDKLF